MANFFRNLIDSLKLQDDDEAFEEYESENRVSERKAVGSERPAFSKTERTAEFERKVRPQQAQMQTRQESSAQSEEPQIKKAHTQSNYGTSTYIESRNNKKTLRMERPEGSKVIPIKTTSDGLEVCVMKPKTLEDSQDICDVLLSGCVAIVNLEDNDLPLSQRFMDFISGAVYSINGKLFQISDLIFIIAPGSVDISGDYNDIVAQSGFDVPILNKNF